MYNQRSPEYPNSFLYEADAPWLSSAKTALYFSIDDVPSIDNEATMNLLLDWAEADPVNLWDADGEITVRWYEGPGDDGVDVYKITGDSFERDPDVPAWVRQEEAYDGEPVAVPIVEIDGSVVWYDLDDFT